MQPTTSEDSPPPSSSARVVILAAGKGTRMKSSLPKALHPLRGLPLIEHALRIAESASGNRPTIVVGHGADAVQAAVRDRADCVLQTPQLGTGHAMRVVARHSPFAADPGVRQILVTAADMPLVRPETLRALAGEQARANAAVVVLTVLAEDPRGFGRIARDASGAVRAIVEEVDCTPEQLAIRELNAAIYCYDAAWLWPALDRITPNPRTGEYFLTDLVALAVAQGRAVRAMLADREENIGINTRIDLADADAALRRRINRAHMLNGVSIIDPNATYIDTQVEIGQDAVILPNTHLLGATRIGPRSVVGPNSVLRDTLVGDGCRISQSTADESRVDDGADVGPYARLRPGAHICERAHVGNYGEIKNSTLGSRSKMGHFSYLGDAEVGADVNIGAGAITCNYDGEKKHRTVIEAGAFIGSDTLLIAPVTVGAGAQTGAGSVVTRDVPPRTLVVGLPARAIRTLPAGE
jgi:bifunctional UDP-N-acetylglucosamine pyrophosphorylase/glucosamine-1-phosphate N-acetyltransferase